MKINWERLSSVGICIFLGFLALFLLGKYLLAAFIPFFAAWFMAWVTNKISAPVSQKLGIGRKLCSSVVLILLFFALGTLLFWAVDRFITEIENFITRLASDGGALSKDVSGIVGKFDDIGSHIPLVREFKNHEQLSALGNQLDEMLNSFLLGLASDLGTALTSFATSAVRALPSIALFLVISIIASFYFALDFENINSTVVSLLPRGLQNLVPRLGAGTKSIASRYLKAYSILMVVTFFEVFIGLSVIGVDYSFLLALLISVLDILPVFGVGTVLIPWSVFSFFTHNFSRGIGLLILWGTVTVIRQIAEPKIVGGTIGLHPVVTLIGMYTGFKLWGFIGMFLAPAAIIAARSYLHSAQANNKTPIDSAQKK